MSTFKDIEENAKLKGITLDTCGSDERHYTFGLYTDYCGMSYEDALAAQLSGNTGGANIQKTNVVKFYMENTSADEYELKITLSEPSTENVNVSFTIDGTPKYVVIPAGQTTVGTGIKNTTKYATVDNIAISSADETYKFKPTNQVETGYFTLTIIVDGNVVSSTAVKYGETITLPDTEERVGYTFNWDEHPDTMPENDLTINGIYTINSHTINWVVEENTIVESVNYGEPITAPVMDEREGYTFNWEEFPATMPDNDLTINGAYTINTYTLTYYVDNEVYDTEAYEYNAVITLKDTVDKEGHTFTGWTLSDGSDVPTHMPAHDIEVNAHFDVNKYNITYYVDGEAYYTKDYDYGSNIKLITNPKKEGHTFSGWDIGLPATMPAYDIEVRGTFTINQYTLRLIYTKDGVETLYREITADYGTPIEVENPEETGYTFRWYAGVPTTMPAADATIYGIFEIKSFPFNLIIKDSADVVKLTVESNPVNYNISIRNEFDRLINEFFINNEELMSTEGYDNNKYSIEVISGNADFVMNDRDMHPDLGVYTVEVKYAAVEYNINYYITPNAETPDMSDTMSFGDDISDIWKGAISGDYLPEGMDFVEWALKDETGELPTIMPAHDVNVTAILRKKTYTITYFVDGVQDGDVETYEYGSEITRRDNPVKEGFAFSGWDIELPATMPAHNIEVNGTFEAINYTVTFNKNGEITTATYHFGETIVYPELVAEEGHTWGTWYYLDGETRYDAPETMPSHDITVIVEKTTNTWTLTFVVNGYDNSASTVSYGTELASLVPQMEPEIDRYGVTYKFRWIDEIPATMPDNDLTINGEYVEKVDSNLVYYGYVLNAESGSTTPSTYATMPSYDASVENPKDVVLAVPADDEMIRISNGYSNSASEQEDAYWQALLDARREEVRFRYWLRIPSQYNLVSVENSGANYPFEKLDRTETNDDTVYNIYQFVGESDTLFMTKSLQTSYLKITLR